MSIQYHPEDFITLSNGIVEDGGVALFEPCEGTEYRMKIPMGKRKVWKTFFTTRCHTSAKFEIPYDPSLHIRLLEDDSLTEDVTIIDHPGEHDKPKMVTVCAVDDAVGLWPRYNEFVTDRSYQS